MKKRVAILLICCLYGILTTSCGVFHPAPRENGYLTNHYYSCGPVALSRALDIYSQKNNIKYKLSKNAKDISIEIQDNRKFIDVVELLVLIDRNAGQITWPEEIQSCLKARSIEVREISSADELAEDVAIVLVRKQGTLDTFHYIVYPWSSLNYYGDKTIFERAFVLIPKS